MTPPVTQPALQTASQIAGPLARCGVPPRMMMSCMPRSLGHRPARRILGGL